MKKLFFFRSGGVAAALMHFGLLGAQTVPLGPIGAGGAGVAGEPLIEVTSLDAGGPGDTAGLQVGDMIGGADGIPFGIHSSNSNDGYQGAIQDLGMAIDRAEGGTGMVNLEVIRSGVGGVSVPVNVGTSGKLGPAWPASSPKTDAIYEWCCEEIHNKVDASSSGNFAYNSGWFGLILLSHPDWNSTSGPRPYRNSINKLRDRCINYLNGRAFEPVEPSIDQPLYDSQSPGLENWDVCSSAMFLALYRSKTGDTGVDAIVQTAAEMIANRIQHWSQYNDAGTVFVPGNGRMGHGGVHGDYSHYNGAGGLNIMNAHAVVSLGLLRQAGADVNAVPGTTLNDSSGDPLPTIDEKFRSCWDWLKQATNNGGGLDDGNVGYVGKQGGGDSSGRTGGAIAGWELYGMAATADDLDHLARQKAYLTRRWFRQQHCHAYTLGGVALSQMAAPFLGDRAERFYQENSAFFSVLSRQTDGSLDYFPGRQNNGGDSYLNTSNVTLVNGAIATAIRSGNLPGFAAPDPDRLLIHIKEPVATWSTLDAREIRLASLGETLEVDITDVDGNVLAPASYSAAWTNVSGPGTIGFSDAAAATTDVTAPADGSYRVQLEVTTPGYTLTEPIDLVIDSVAPPADVAPYIVTQPHGVTAEQGGTVTLNLAAQGSEPLVYQWRKNGQPVGSASTSPLLDISNLSASSAGDYDCVVTNAAGTVTSATATVAVEGVGGFAWGGLWSDLFTGISGSSVADLTSSANYPDFPDAGLVLDGGEAPEDYADNYGRRISGWITPPEDGNYTFYLASDDSSELYLSTDATRANRQLIVSLNGYRGYRAWSGAPSSSSISLIGGQRYYVEVLHKEGGGGDHCGFTWNWDSPGVWNAPSNSEVPLPGAVLEYQIGGTVDDLVQPPADYTPVADPASYTVFGGTPLALTLTGSDFEPGALGFTVVDPPSKGTLSGTAPNLTYTPDPGASGSDSFTFIVDDGVNDSLPAQVSLSLVPESGSNLKVWEGGTDASWAVGSNWIGGSAPGASDAAIFDDQALANFATDTGAGTSIARLVVLDPLGALSIAGGTLQIGDGIEMNAATEDLTIFAPVAVGAAQEWAIGPDGSLTVSGGISGSGAVTKTGTGELEVNGTSSYGGEWIVDAGTLRLSGGGWYAGYVGGNTTLRVREGATVVNVNTHSFGSGATPSRDIVLEGGTFRFEAETYFDDAEVTGGRFEGPGEMRSRSGSGTVVTVRAADASAEFAAPFNAVGSTTLVVEDGAATADLLMTGDLRGGSAILKDGDGRMVIASDATYSGALTVRAGSVVVNGSLAAGSSVLVEGTATIEGTGSVLGALTQDGVMLPGDGGPAVLALGSLTQSGTAATLVEIGGPTAGQDHDQVMVAGSATLDGALNVTLIDGFVPVAGQGFTVLSAASRTGSFSAYNLPGLPAGLSWQVVEDPGGSPGVALEVISINQPPSFVSDPLDGGTTPEDGSFTGTLAASASDPDAGDTLTFTKESGPAWLNVAPDGSLTGVPANGDVGLNAFAVRVTDLAGAFDEVTLEVTVTNMNDDPAFTADPLPGGNGVQGTPYTGTLAGSAADVDVGDSLDFSKSSGPAWLTVAPDGSMSGTPGAGDVGTNAFVVRVTDLAGAFDEAAFTVEVANVNDAPGFVTDPIAGAGATEDAPYTGTLAGSATDLDAGDTLTFSKQSGPAWLSVASNGALTGTPGNDEVGSNAFVVRVTDVAGEFDEATLNIEVTNVNDPPTWNTSPVVLSGAVEEEAFSGSLATHADDVDAGDTLSFSKVSGPAWLTVAGGGALSGTPPNGSEGTESFTVRVEDLAGAGVNVTLEIGVTASNDPPAFTSDPIAGAGATEDAPYAGTLAGTADDPNTGDTLTFTKTAGPAWLVVAGDGALSGTPDNGDVGANAFTVRVTDDAGEFDEATLNLEVTNVNDPPVFGSDPVMIGGAVEDEAFSGTSLAGTASDPDAGDTLTYSKVSGPSWLTVAGDGSLSGTPPAGSAGTEVFTVRVDDVAGEYDEASLEIAVEAAELSLPWEQMAIGTAQVPGEATDSAGVFSVSGGGRLAGGEDNFQFVYQPMEDDGEIVARVRSLDDTGGEARVGIMIRDSLAPNSRHVFIGVDGSGDFRWVRRTSAGGRAATSGSGSSVGGDAWLKLSRSGGMIFVRRSLDGVNWVTLGALTANLPPTTYAGLVVASGDDAVLNASSFDSVDFTP